MVKMMDVPPKYEMMIFKMTKVAHSGCRSCSFLGSKLPPLQCGLIKILAILIHFNIVFFIFCFLLS